MACARFLDLKYGELGQDFRKFSLFVLHSQRGALFCYFCDDMQVLLDLFLHCEAEVEEESVGY